MTARRIGISYSRLSDPYKQAHGDSEDRQERMYRAFCQAHNLTPLTERFLDRCSGYKDEHRKKGRLGVLIEYAKDAAFEPGTVIVVEAWDRLGRLRPDRQTELVAELLRTGVCVGICRLNDIFSEDDFGTHKWTILSTFIMLAYQESKQKAERVAASWDKRREKAREKPKSQAQPQLMTSVVPAWLAYVDGETRLIPERAAAVRRIFQLAAEGYGQTRIVRTLTGEGIAPLGDVVLRPGSRRSAYSGKWNTTYIAMILTDRRVLGELQPRKADGKPDGPAIAHYYPSVVTETEFEMARAGRRGRSRGWTRSGCPSRNRDGKYVNAFRGLLRHARDGDGFFLHNTRTTKQPQLLLVNSNGLQGRSHYFSFPYRVFEDAILGLLCELDPRAILPKEQHRVSEIELLRAQLKNIRHDLAQLGKELFAMPSKTVAAVIHQKEAQEEQVAERLQEELARAAQPAVRAWQELPKVRQMIRDGGDAVRLRVRSVLGRMVDEIWLLIVRRGTVQTCVAQVFFAGGAHRDFLIAHWAAGKHRKSRWAAGSLPPAHASKLDLRQPDHVRRLEKWLAAFDLTSIK
jgi:DNA invertase Pin-like site-specific DNA recombinase